MTTPAPIRPEVLAALLRLGEPGLTEAQDKLINAATDAEWAALRAIRVAEHEATMAAIRRRWDDIEERAACRYWRWRAGHRDWDRTRPWAPAPRSAP